MKCMVIKLNLNRHVKIGSMKKHIPVYGIVDIRIIIKLREWYADITPLRPKILKKNFDVIFLPILMEKIYHRKNFPCKKTKMWGISWILLMFRKFWEIKNYLLCVICEIIRNNLLLEWTENITLLPYWKEHIYFYSKLKHNNHISPAEFCMQWTI